MLNDRPAIILIAICAALFFVCPLTEVVAQNKKQNDSVLGEGHGIDHVGILVRDPKGRRIRTAIRSGFGSSRGAWLASFRAA